MEPKGEQWLHMTVAAARVGKGGTFSVLFDVKPTQI
jgi:hypothetical protein